nr:hypothetical protein Iba_chr12aCG19460 [Ipomoea batatas]GMD64408.1 hypothetical protein Iba_chr12bCG24100 [Ipomoea batatas]
MRSRNVKFGFVEIFSGYRKPVGRHNLRRSSGLPSFFLPVSRNGKCRFSALDCVPPRSMRVYVFSQNAGQHGIGCIV